MTTNTPQSTLTRQQEQEILDLLGPEVLTAKSEEDMWVLVFKAQERQIEEAIQLQEETLKLLYGV